MWMGMVVLCTTFSYIRGSDSHISLENIATVYDMYCRGAIIGIAKIELAGNKVLRNDLAAPRSGAVATWSSERPYFCPIVLEAKNSPSIHKLDCSYFSKKLRIICSPFGVMMDSGWNCTPYIG